MAQAAVKDTTGYVNYVYNISARGTTEVASQLLGLSGMATNILGQLAFQTSSYLSTTEGALLSMGVIATAGFTKATQQAMEFDQALSTVGAISGKTRGEVADLGEDAMAMSSKFGVAVSEMTQGMESLARAGVSQGNMTAILEEAMGLSKLEGLTLDTAINDLISTTNLLDTQGLDLSSAEYADAIRYQNQKITATSEAAPINAQDIIHTLEHIGGYASSTNLDQDDLYAVIAQLGSKGTKSEMAGTSLRAFISAGQKDTAQRALKRIGLNVKDLWKNDDTIMSITDMKDVLDEAMESRGYTQQEKLEFYSDFAGYKQANQIMKIDTQSAREFKEKIDHSWNMGQKINQVIGTAETHVQGLIQAGTNLLTKVGEPFLPIISTIAWTLRTGIDMINAIPGSNLIIAGGLILASVKAISTIFNKIVPQIVAAKGNIGSMGGFFGTIKKDLKESYTIIKNINNTDWIQKQAHQNEMNHVSEDEKLKYWRQRTGKRLYGMTDVYRLEKKHRFTNDQPYIDWKRRERYGTRDSRNERHETQNEPTGATESSNNRKDNKKSDCCDLIIQVIKEGFVAQIYNTNTIKDRVSDIYTFLTSSLIDKPIIEDLKKHTFKVEVVNMANIGIPAENVSSLQSEKSTTTPTKSSTEIKTTSQSVPQSKTKLFTKGKLDQTKVDKFIDDFYIDFGFDQSTTEGQKSQEFMLNYAKDILRDNFKNNRNKLTGQSKEVLEKRISNELKNHIASLGEHKLGSVISARSDVKNYTDEDLSGISIFPNIDYNPNLKSKSDILKDLGLDYNKIRNNDKVDTEDYLKALAHFGGVDLSSVDPTKRTYRSNMAKEIAEGLKDVSKKDKIKSGAISLNDVLTNRIAYHYINDLDQSAQKKFMKSVGLEYDDNPYIAMVNYMKNSVFTNKKGKTEYIMKPKDLDTIMDLGNITELTPSKLNISSRSPYRRDLGKGPNVKNEVNSATERAIDMMGLEGYMGIGSHIKKITDAAVELAVQQDIAETQKEMEKELGRKVSVSEAIRNMPSLAQPNRFKWKVNDYDDVGKISPDTLDVSSTIFNAAQQMHDDKIGGNEKFKNRTKGSRYGQLERTKLVHADNKDVYFEEEMEELSNLSLAKLLSLTKPPDISLAYEDIGSHQVGGNNTGIKNVGVSELEALPFMFEGQAIKGVFKRLPTHGRDMQNTAVMGEEVIGTYLGKDIVVPQLQGYLRNDKGRYHEAYSWALQQKRNREMMQRNQSKVFGNIALNYGLSRQQITDLPLTQLQKDRINLLYSQQDFVDIEQYKKHYQDMYDAATPEQQKLMMTGEEALRQLRGQMAAARKVDIGKNGEIIDNGSMFEIEVTPEEYRRRKDANLIYTDEGDEGILKTRKDKHGNEYYTINDFESLHYSYNDIKRRVLLEDVLRAKELESTFNDSITEEYDFGMSIGDEDLQNFTSISGTTQLNPKDLANAILETPKENIKKMMYAIYLFDKDVYTQVVNLLGEMYPESAEDYQQVQKNKTKKIDQAQAADIALDLVYGFMPDFVDSLTPYDKDMIQNATNPMSELLMWAQIKGGVDVETIEKMGKDDDLTREFNEAMNVGSLDVDAANDKISINSQSVADVIDLETREDINDYINGAGVLSSSGDMAAVQSESKWDKIREAIDTDFDENSLVNYRDVLNNIEAMQSAPLTGEALNTIGVLSHMPKYYDPNLVWKETTPGGDEEPTILDVDKDALLERATWINIQKAISEKPSQYSSKKTSIKDHFMSEDDLWLFTQKYGDLIDYSQKSKLLVKGTEGNEIPLTKQITPNIVNQAMENLGFNSLTVKGYQGRNTLIGTSEGSINLIFQELANILNTQQTNATSKNSTSQVNGVNINPNSTDWNQVGEALKEGQKRAQDNARKTVIEPMQDSFLSEIDVSLFNNIGTNLNNKTQIGGYEQGREVVDNIKQRLDNFISPKVDTLYGKFGDRDNSNITDKLGGWSDKLTDATDTLQGFSVYLQEASELFPPLSVAVLGLETVITTITKINEGSQVLSSFLSIGDRLKSGDEIKFLGQVFSSDNNAGKMLMSVTGIVGEAFETLTTIFWKFLGPIALITAGLIAIKGALDWSYQSHEKYLKSLQEEQKEKRSKVKGLQATAENTKNLAEKNTAPRQQDRLDRNAQLAQTKLDNANMTRSHGAIEITRQKNDMLWGDYGISAGLSKISGNYESTAGEYEGTSEQIRKIKEETVANPFSTESMNQVAAYYDANQLAFGVMDEYKDELGQLYDSETSAMLKYHTTDVRESPEFQKALDKFVEATGITRDHAQQYLDYMQTEHNVDKATQSMQAQADQIAASTELKVQAIAFGGNPADVLGLNGIQAQQDSMIKAQADMIKIELSGQLWWKAVWSTIAAPIKLILSPIFIITDLLSAIWSFITGNWGDAFDKAGKAGSRLNVFGEAATYWGAWAQVEGTDFNSIGQNATDDHNRANYGNVEQPASGGYHPTHYIDSNNGQDRKEAIGGGYYNNQPPMGGYSDHRESRTHFMDANRGSYHFVNKQSSQNNQPAIQFNPLDTISSMLGTIISILTTGLLVGGGIYGLSKIIQSNFSLEDIGAELLTSITGSDFLGNILGKGSGILNKIFKTDNISSKTKGVLGEFFNFDGIKELGGEVKNIIPNLIGSFKGTQEEAEWYRNGEISEEDVSLSGKLYAKGLDVKDKVQDNVWYKYGAEKLGSFKDNYATPWADFAKQKTDSFMLGFAGTGDIEDFNKKKRKGMNKSDREYLNDKYDLGFDLSEFATANQANKAIRNKLDESGQWDTAMKDMYVNKEKGGYGNLLKERYVDPWKEHAKNQVKTRVDGVKEEAEWYRNGAISEEDVSTSAKYYAKGLDIKDNLMNKIGLQSTGSIGDLKEAIQDPNKMEQYLKDRLDSFSSDSTVGQYRDKAYKAQELMQDPEALFDHIKNSDYISNVKQEATNYLKDPETGDGASIPAKIMGKGMQWKEKYLGEDSMQDILADPARVDSIIKGTYQDIQGGALDDLNISDTIKDKMSGLFGQVKDGIQEGIDESDEEGGGQGGLFENAKKKLAGWFEGGDQEEYDWYQNSDLLSFGDLSPKNKMKAIGDKAKDTIMGSKLFDWYREEPDEEYQWHQDADAIGFGDLSAKNQMRATMDTKGEVLKENGLSSLNIGKDAKEQIKTKLGNAKSSLVDKKDKLFSTVKGKFTKSDEETAADKDPDSIKNRHKRGEWSEGMLDHNGVTSEPLVNMSKVSTIQAESSANPLSKYDKFLKPENKDPEGQKAFVESGLSNMKMSTIPSNMEFKESSAGAMGETASILDFNEDVGSAGQRIMAGENPADVAKDTIKNKLTGGKEGVEGANNALKTGGKGAQKLGGALKGKGGIAGKAGGALEKIGGGASKAGGKGIQGMAKGGLGKLGKTGVGKAGGKLLGKVGGKIAGKVGGKALAQVGSKVLGGALMATGIGAPLGMLLESPIGGFLMEGAMDLGGKALGAIGGALGGIGSAIGGLFGFGDDKNKKGGGGGLAGGLLGAGAGLLGGVGGAIGGLLGGGQAAAAGSVGGPSGGMGAGMGALGMLGGGMGMLGMLGGGMGLMGMLGGILGGQKPQNKEKGAGVGQLMKMMSPFGMITEILTKTHKDNKRNHSKTDKFGDLIGKILTALTSNKDNNNNKNNNSGGNITIQNININTADDPEAIKAMFLELLIELQEQVNPRLVSRTVGQSPSSSSTDTNTETEDQEEQTDTTNSQSTDQNK